MRKLKALMTMLALAIPLVGLGAVGVEAAQRPGSHTEIQGDGTAANCCWVYYFGRWYCVPC